jgi:hypothetical protein
MRVFGGSTARLIAAGIDLARPPGCKIRQVAWHA